VPQHLQLTEVTVKPMKVIVAASAALAASLLLAPAASADAGTYLQDLSNYGITVNNPDGAVHDGIVVCQTFGHVALADVVDALQRNNPGLKKVICSGLTPMGSWGGGAHHHGWCQE
jgi:hypothetical protein